MIELRWKKKEAGPLHDADGVVVKICDPKLYGLYDYAVLQYRFPIETADEGGTKIVVKWNDWKDVDV